MRWSAVLLALTGCSQLFGLASPQLGDGGGSGDDDAPIGDGPRDDVPVIPPGTCTNKWIAGPTITSLMSLTVNTTADEKSPFVTADGLDLYYSKDSDVYIATRMSTSGDFGGETKVNNLSSPSFEGKTFVSSNKLRAFFSSTRGGGGSSGGYDLYRGSRNNTGQNFAVDQTYVTTLNTAANEIDPHLTDDLLHIYYSTIDNASPAIAFATRATINDNFGTPTILTELSSGAGENGPTLTADELVIVFASNRIGGLAATNLWYATRTSKTAAFGTPKVVPNVNTDAFDDTPHLTPDGCMLYYSSSSSASYDLYAALIQ